VSLPHRGESLQAKAFRRNPPARCISLFPDPITQGLTGEPGRAETIRKVCGVARPARDSPLRPARQRSAAPSSILSNIPRIQLPDDRVDAIWLVNAGKRPRVFSSGGGAARPTLAASSKSHLTQPRRPKMGYSPPKKQLDLKEFLSQPAKRLPRKNRFSFRNPTTKPPEPTAEKVAGDDGGQSET
jgi:hypothetical protein